jgi:hypothetical protein
MNEYGFLWEFWQLLVDFRYHKKCATGVKFFGACVSKRPSLVKTVLAAVNCVHKLVIVHLSYFYVRSIIHRHYPVAGNRDAIV